MSRLLESSEQIRENLQTRNLYTPTDPYNLDNRQLVNTINSIASIIAPFTSFDLTNTVIGRLIGPNTPIAQIGLVMLGKQFAATVASNASADFLPSISFTNLFDGDPNTKFITRKQDFQITRRESQTNLGRILDSITGVYNYSNQGNPFSADNQKIQGSGIKEYVENTGLGQLEIFFSNIQRNVYKLEDSGFIEAMNGKNLEVSLGDSLLVNNVVFPFPDEKFYPFQQYISTQSAIGAANDDFIASEREFLRSNRKYGVKEYGNNEEYLQAMGKTRIRDNNDGAGNYNYDSFNYGLNDGSNEQIVWGRDGVTQEYREQSLSIENPYAGVTEINPRFDTGDKINDFEIQTGLLSYTRQLLNSKGRYGSFDMVRKKFVDTNEQLHFNGSPLDTRPDTGELDLSRRHSAADPYDRYVKAIRFDGNQIYNGNESSVINKTVIPKFAPSLNGSTVDNRNLMFSLENLAVEVRRDEIGGIAFLNDSNNTSLPMCEAGPSGGRLMWFPPYDVRLTEQAVARWEHTTFIGRGEPIYTYGNSERLATLSFKMLVDYPEQLINYRQRGEAEFQKTISEFFAFGGAAESPQFDTNISQKEALLQQKINEREELKTEQISVEPNVPSLGDFDFYFPNNYPTTSGVGSVQEVIDLGYEDGFVTSDEIDGVDYGLNETFNIFFSSPSPVLEQLFNPDNSNLYNDDRPYLDIVIQAGATVLFNPTEGQEEFNKQLSRRRQLAMVQYLEDLFVSTFGRTASDLNVNIRAPESLALGSTQGDPSNNTAATIPELDAKQERYAKITFERNGNMFSKTIDTTVDNQEAISILNEEIAALENEIQSTKRLMAQYSPCVFETPTKEGGYEKGFSSVFNDRFYPTFHSQTPEDFHRRLTFLHQCTRQGPAIRVPTNDGLLSSKNSVFGRQPVCVFRYGDFFHTKVVIDNISFDYNESTWDLNPEGFGMQPMIADITIQMRVIGGQSLKTPIDALQNAVSFNYYANSTYTNVGLYNTPSNVEILQIRENELDGLSRDDKNTFDEIQTNANNLSDQTARIPESTQ